MKNYISKIALLVCLFVVVVGCSDDEPTPPAEPTAQETAFELLSGQWSLQATNGVVVDNVDRTLNYDGFTISFTNGRYTTSNAGDLFQASGTWEWANGTTENQVIFDDGKSITFQTLTQNTLVLSFNQSDGGVRAGVAGNYVISLMK